MQTRSAAMILRGGAQGLMIAPLAGLGMMWHHFSVTPPSLCSAAGGNVLRVALCLLLFEMVCLAAAGIGWNVLMRAKKEERAEDKTAAAFIRAGSLLLPLGLVMSFGMILHCVARYATAAPFLANATLWYECPWALSTLAVLGGSLGMVGIGLVNTALERPCLQGTAAVCTVALVAMFFTGYAGYFVVGRPGFYYSPAGQSAWLLAQLGCMILYAVGAFAAFNVSRRAILANGHANGHAEGDAIA